MTLILVPRTDEIESDPPTCESSVGISPGDEVAIAPTGNSPKTKLPSKGAQEPEQGESSSADIATPSALGSGHNGDPKSVRTSTCMHFYVYMYVQLQFA